MSRSAISNSMRRAMLSVGLQSQRWSVWPDMDPETMTMDDAKRILAFPRSVGVHPKHGLDIMVQDGRYGPYVSMEGEDIKESRQLENHAHLESITLEGALELLAQPAAWPEVSDTGRTDCGAWWRAQLPRSLSRFELAALVLTSQTDR